MFPPIIAINLIQNLRAYWDEGAQLYMIDCESAETLGDWVFTIGGNDYVLGAQDYIIDVS
jgi:hypothetical protein